jgi:hypothetical protein
MTQLISGDDAPPRWPLSERLGRVYTVTGGLRADRVGRWWCSG